MSDGEDWFKRLAVERRFKRAKRRLRVFVNQDERVGFKEPERILQLTRELEEAREKLRALGGQP